MSFNNIPTADNWLQFVQNKVGAPLPGEIAGCLMCSKPFVMRNYIGYPDQVCPDCYDTYKDCAALVCIKCNVVVAKIQPQLMPSGFYIRPNSTLHIQHCNVCSPTNCCSTNILEIYKWELEHGKTHYIDTKPLILQ